MPLHTLPLEIIQLIAEAILSSSDSAPSTDSYYGAKRGWLQTTAGHDRTTNPATHNLLPLLLTSRHLHNAAIPVLTSIFRVEKDYLLLYAACIGNNHLLQRVLELGADVNTVDKYGECALHYAATNSDENIVRTLLQHGASVSTTSKQGETPLYCAISSLEVVVLLVDAGANIESRNEYGQTPLHVLTRSGREDISVYLINVGADIFSIDHFGSTPMDYAISGLKTSIVELLLEKGISIHGRVHRHMSALYHTITHGQADLVDLLLRHGDYKTLHQRNHNGLFPLDVAIICGHSDIAATLIVYGAVLLSPPQALLGLGIWQNSDQGIRMYRNVEATLHTARNPLRPEIRYSNVETAKMVDMLLEYSAGVDSVDIAGGTPLHEVVSELWRRCWWIGISRSVREKIKMVRVLLTYEADAKTGTQSGRTVMQLAVWEMQKYHVSDSVKIEILRKIVQALFVLGFRGEQPDRARRTAWET